MLLKEKIILALFLIAVQLPGQDIKALLPVENEIAGWKAASEPGIYEGDDLFELINGGADLYHEYGFVQVLSVHYADTSLNNLLVEIYEMEDAPSAYGIFSITRLASEWSVRQGTIFAIAESYISSWKDRYFITVSFASGKKVDGQGLRSFTENISAKINKVGTYPSIVNQFRDLSDNGKLVYLEGNIALSNFYYFDYRNIFQLHEAVAGSATGYHWIIMNYADSIAAQAVLTDTKLKVSENKRFTDLEMTFHGFSCRDNKSNLILVRQAGHYIAIIVAVDPAIQLVPLMDEISLKIENE